MSSQKITQNLRLEKWVEQCIFDINKNINHSFYVICDGFHAEMQLNANAFGKMLLITRQS